MDKGQLRRHVRRVVEKLSDWEKELQSERLFQRLIQHPRYQQARRMSVYLSTENEIDTKPIVRYSLEVACKECFVPVVAKNRQQVDQYFGGLSRMMMVELKSMEHFERLAKNSFGIREPTVPEGIEGLRRVMANPREHQALDLDLILVPGVAFSRDGSRLGHGKGYYDEFLNCLARHNPKLYTIGLAFKEQLVDGACLQMIEGHDFRLNEILYTY